MKELKKAGRKRLNDEVLTQAEKTRRYKMRRKIFVEEAAKQGFSQIPLGVVIHKSHLDAIKQIIEGEWQNRLTAGEISNEIFKALKAYIEKSHNEIDAVKSEDWPQYSFIESCELTANSRFADWEKQQ